MSIWVYIKKIIVLHYWKDIFLTEFTIGISKVCLFIYNYICAHIYTYIFYYICTNLEFLQE